MPFASHDPPGRVTLGFSIPDRRIIWFRYLPPPPIDFAHELIHLARKRRGREFEEVYSYNLSGFIVWLARNNIDPLLILSGYSRTSI